MHRMFSFAKDLVIEHTCHAAAHTADGAPHGNERERQGKLDVLIPVTVIWRANDF